MQTSPLRDTPCVLLPSEYVCVQMLTNQIKMRLLYSCDVVVPLTVCGVFCIVYDVAAVREGWHEMEEGIGNEQA